MEASASPRNPRVWMEFRSVSSVILLVAWRMKAVEIYSGSMPLPLSLTSISLTPPDSMETVIWVAPASMEFSISSLATEAGRSTTSPAAISSAVCLSSTRMMAMQGPPFKNQQGQPLMLPFRVFFSS